MYGALWLYFCTCEASWALLIYLSSVHSSFPIPGDQECISFAPWTQLFRHVYKSNKDELSQSKLSPQARLGCTLFCFVFCLYVASS